MLVLLPHLTCGMLVLLSYPHIRKLGLRPALRRLQAVIVVEPTLLFLRNPISLDVRSILHSLLGVGYSDSWVLTVLELCPCQGDEEMLGAQDAA
jgi:hypothetical protein